MGAYANKVNATRNAGLSPEQIGANNCQRLRSQHLTIKEANRRKYEEAMKNRRDPHEQLQRLDEAYGKGKGDTRERAKLAERIATAAASKSKEVVK